MSKSTRKATTARAALARNLKAADTGTYLAALKRSEEQVKQLAQENVDLRAQLEESRFVAGVLARAVHVGLCAIGKAYQPE
jgi:hypothetical protein